MKAAIARAAVVATRRAFALIGFAVVGILVTWTAASNSNGAPVTAAKTGCTCHNQTPDTAVQVTLTGLPTAYAINTSYEFTLAIAGGPAPVPGVSQNQGGFAIEVSGGRFATSPQYQLKTDNRFATHVGSSNDQRSWVLTWQSPDNATSPVTFYYAGNAVNGDGTNAGGLDHWNKGTLDVPPAHAADTTSTQASKKSPGPEVLAVLGAVALVLVARRR